MGYDIFLSYKNTDENGCKTKDFAIASNLYTKLTQLGYKVFFSEDSLEQLGSSRYKADIDKALDDSKVMIVVLTKSEYASSQWIQYEWDSFYGDYLSGVKKEAHLYTLTDGVQVSTLPRTLRNVQNFEVEESERLIDFIKNLLPANEIPVEAKSEGNISIVVGKQVTKADIMQAVELDRMVYDDVYHIDASVCEKWFEVNPDIYVMAKDTEANKVVAYVNISPVTEECYERIKKGDFVDTGITADMVLSYDMPFPYSVYFSSIVIHPEYQNSEVFMRIFNAIVDKFITLGEHEVFIKRMIADAVTKNGEKFCKLFGMQKIKGSDHNSSLYEVSLIPPRFRVLSKKCKILHDYYQRKYEEAPYLFDDENS